MRTLRPLGAFALVSVLAACGTTPSAALPAMPTFDATAAVAAIRASGGADASELDVRPLRDPAVEDLREQAAALEARRMFRAAADTLDHALAINPDDPALLQERAEAALLLGKLPDAERYAQRAFANGSRVGPLCRRHWETIAQVRAAPALAPATAGGATGPAAAADARRRRDACTVAAPQRY